MILFGDYHTHTIYSHGKGSVLENAQVAVSKGLKQIAISDHGFAHKTFALKRKELDKLFQDIDDASKKTGLIILRGVEANFTSLAGDIDVGVEDYSHFDVILCGYHKLVKAQTIKDKFGLLFANNLALLPSKSQIEKNTAAVLKALEKNRIDVLTHLNSTMKVDTLKVARMARDTGTYIELNERRMLFTPDELASMFAEKVNFVVSSDAHMPRNVGECNKVLNVLRRLDLPTANVANIGKCPVFKKYRSGEIL